MLELPPRTFPRGEAIALPLRPNKKNTGAFHEELRQNSTHTWLRSCRKTPICEFRSLGKFRKKFRCKQTIYQGKA